MKKRRAKNLGSEETTAQTIPMDLEWQSADRVSEPEYPPYTVARAHIDGYGRTRTWSLKNPYGQKIAEITTKRAAERLAKFLTEVMEL